MRALTKLQGSIVAQAATDDGVSRAMNARAKAFITASIIVASTMTPGVGDAGTQLAPPEVVLTKTPLSINERSLLDAMSKAALDAKSTWKKSLYDIGVDHGNQKAQRAAQEAESAARQDLGAKRDAFLHIVETLNTGSPEMAPRAVDRHMEIAGSLMDLNTSARVSYAMLAVKDEQLRAQNPAYAEESRRAAQMHAYGQKTR